jgi:hypothetical protein
MKRWLLRISIGLLVVLVAIQFVPVARTNPAVTKPLVAPPEIESILRRSCYDCHSNETRWPWYAHVAPISWLVADDVEKGRKHLNLSAWGDYNSDKRSGKADEMAEQVEQGAMPLAQYLWMHSDAKLSPADVALLRKWADGVE